MRLASYLVGSKAEFGIVVGDSLIDLSARTRASSLRTLLGAGGLAEAARFAAEIPDRSLDSVKLLPVIPDCAHCYCVGVNYEDHLREVQQAGVARPRPKQPSLFIRYPETFVAHGSPLLAPKVSDDLDYEAELAVIVAKGGRYIPREQAMDHVAGYSCFNDGSVRDWQFHSSQVTSGKNFVGTGGFGPWLVTPDEIGDAGDLSVRLVVNEQILQDGRTSDMLFDVAAIVSYASAFLPLQPGDVIATGTPAGVGFSRNPPIFLKPGDVCEVRIEGVGTLRNGIVKAAE
ncbi:fumarylacetoacetate hydrolase family protein [Rhodoplanes sp. Z2-YC6860]|uniref:fumarylacetoacetate hydrolase family protein n=1 Tax=Rhodoplanes sp. Z2-YC6860 TaxID=674703 RepID=UPI00078E030E|nr:fumarylacetoacetate hydrolase family protein [Rhodoplanes sp. Z2-YC6860]AMN39630.1 5-carboxymethyl-2-hydroxymuconate Delta-isomerase [Rhodoplanes sp. Z2-YC6860]